VSAARGALLLVVCTVVGTEAAVAVPWGYQRVAEAEGVPATLLYALALAESGTPVPSQGTTRPWPWTLNVDGAGRYYRTREAAAAALERALAGGAANVDIGLMQVSWRYHAPRLGSPAAALDPDHNLAVAARIFRACFEARGDWWAAVGCYHAPNDRTRAERYRARVRAHWERLGEGG
jgi:hypothetical protein